MIVVLGAGIVGLLTAYDLAMRGQRVTVVDRESGPALGCSHSNAGIIAVGHADAWAGPAAIASLVSAMFGRNPAVKIVGLPDLGLLRWGTAFLANCTSTAHVENSRRMERLSLFSRKVLREVDEREGLDYHQQHAGTIYIFRDKNAFEGRRARIADARNGKHHFRVLSVDEIVDMEPAFRGAANDLAGGFLSTVDSSGDCALFARELTRLLQETYGVTFRFGEAATGVECEADKVRAVRTDAGSIGCDGVVVALGASSPGILETIGIKPLIYPIKGYSATYPLLEPANAPRLSFIDETELVACSRFGNQVRLTGMAEFDRGRERMISSRRDVLDRFARRTFGEAADVANGTYWAGSRPSTPSGSPYLGRLKEWRNIWINAGHGQLGWTMAAGCGRLVSDLICGVAPEIGGVSARAPWLKAI